MKILSIINKLYKKAKFAIYCMPFGDDERFVRTVKKIGKENNLVNIMKYGERIPDRNIYFIDMEESGAGFFCDYNNLLSLLFFADYYDMKPVVRYHENFCYAEKEPVNGTINPFEYYFMQPSDTTLNDLYEMKTVYKSKKENSYFARDLFDTQFSYTRSEEYLNNMARISAKYIRLNSDTEQRIKKDIYSILKGKRTLALHVRGTDFKRNYNGHPIAVSEDEFLEQAVLLMQKGYDQVFLATDSIKAIKIFKDEFGDKVVYYNDVIRSDEMESVMYSVSKRKQHHYLLGLEVLRDMHTLAACTGLIAGLSQVSIAARIHKKSVGEEYEDLIILNKGINSHKIENCPTK